MDCLRWAKKEIGTAPSPKAKEYQKLKVGAFNQEEESELEIDLYTTDDEESEEESMDEEEEASEHELQQDVSEHESEMDESVSRESNWWYSEF